MKTIDQRIVEMGFDNKKFEDGIQTSIKSLDKLKKGLQLDEASRSLSKLASAGRNFSLEGIAAGVDKLNSKFSTMGIIGITAIQNITNSALNAGKRIVDSLTIAPIRTGLDEYETKLNSIQTILTNTESKGTTLKEVTAVLDELNEYSDQTIYNFAEMTRNIGTFTAAGVDLKSSAVAIKGIANLAAGSGSNAQQASTAMYQLSQALAAGSVKLMDWNSVVNAGMGGELFQNALKKNAKALDVFVDETVPFRESLQDGWLTSKVLIKTLEEFANNESLIQAATQVKTFTQLINTMQESVQSGWAVSWEKIIGNKDQAAKLFTGINNAFGEVIGRSSDARNALLDFWNVNGGRTAIIDGVTSAVKEFAKGVGILGKAFREIFPALTGEQLVLFSKKLKELLLNFKIGDETALNLSRTFKGLFAILDIGKYLLSELGSGVISFLKGLGPIGDGILSITANMGDAIVELRNAVKQGQGIAAFINKVKDLFKPLAVQISNTVKAIGDGLTAIANTDTSGLETFSQKMALVFSPLVAFGNILMNGAQKIFPVVADVFESMGTIIVKMFSKISEELKNLEFTTIISILNGAFLMGLLSSMKKFVKELTDVTGGGKTVVGNIKALLEGVGGALEAYQSNLQAKTLLMIAGSIAVLAASLFVLSKIEPERLTQSLEAVGILFAQMFVASGVFGKIFEVTKTLNAAKAVITLIGLATALNILTSALKKLVDLSWGDLAKGLVGIQGLVFMLTTSMNAFEKTSKYSSKAAIGMIAMAAAINMLSDAVTKLSSIDTGSLMKGLIAVGVLMTEMAIFTNFAKLNKVGPLSAIGLLGLAAALNVLAIAVGALGAMGTEQLKKGLVTIGVLLTELTLFLNMTKGAKHVISTSIGLTILSGALLLLTQSLKQMGGMKVDEIGRGLLAMGGALAIIAVAMRMMPLTMVVTSVGLIAVGVAINLLGHALTKLAQLSLGEIGRGLLALGGALAIVATGMMAMALGLPGAVAMGVMAAALTVFIPLIGMLSSIPFLGIVAGLGALAAVFAILGVATTLLTPLAPAMLTLGAAIAVLGGGLVVVGAGVTLFSTGLALLANSIGLVVSELIKSGGDILKIIPGVFKALLESVKEIAEVIKKAAPAFVDAFVSLLDVVIKAIVLSIPKIIDAFVRLVTDVLSKLAKFVPEFMKYGVSIIVGILDGLGKGLPSILKAGIDVVLKFLKGIADNIFEIAAIAVKIVVNFVKGVASMIPKVIQAGFELIVNFINGLAEAIRKNTPLLIDATHNLMSAIIESAIYTLTSSVKWFYDVGKNVVDGFIGGIKNKFADVAKWAGNMALSALNTVKEVLGIHSPSRVFRDEVGAMIAQGTAEGIKKDSSKAEQAAEKMSKAIFDNAKSWIDDRKYYNKLSLEEEYYTWQELQKKFKAGTEERKQADRELYRLKNELQQKEFNNSVNWINERKARNEISMGQELALWVKVQARYAKGTEERKQADQEVYNLQLAIAEKRKALEKDYYDTVTQINDKLKADVKSLNDAYEQALKTRTDALYNAYALFDEVTAQEPVSGQSLIKNLEDQVKAFESWQKNIATLDARGLDQTLLKELQEMGPKSSAQIDALTKMSDAELSKYSSLWKQKYSDAKNQATWELGDLRVSTLREIAALTYSSQTELEKLRTSFVGEMSKLNIETTGEISKMNTAVSAETTKMTSSMLTTTKKLASDVKAVDWQSVGKSIVNSMSSGVQKQAATLTDTVMRAAQEALAAVKNLIENGTQYTPTIRPVMDTSNIDKVLSGLDRTVSATNTLNLAEQASNSVSGKASSGANIHYIQNNYSPEPLSRLDVYRQTRNQLNTLKGVLATE